MTLSRKSQQYWEEFVQTQNQLRFLSKQAKKQRSMGRGDSSPDDPARAADPCGHDGSRLRQASRDWPKTIQFQDMEIAEVSEEAGRIESTPMLSKRSRRSAGAAKVRSNQRTITKSLADEESPEVSPVGAKDAAGMQTCKHIHPTKYFTAAMPSDLEFLDQEQRNQLLKT